MYYKKIVGERIYLSPADLENETDILTAWANEDQVLAYRNGFYDSLLGKEKARDMITRWNEGPFLFSIVSLTDNNFMGHITLFDVAPYETYATMAIYLGREYRGQGYAKEAVSLIVDYAFDTQRFKAIHLEVYSFNDNALKMYEKSGFVVCGRWHNICYNSGEYCDIVLMELLREDWKRQKML